MTILKEFSWCKEYGIECLKIAITEWSQSVTIYDSYKKMEKAVPPPPI